MHLLNLISSLLLVIGGLNLGLMGILDINLVQMLFGSFGPTVTDIVYGLVGLAAVHYIMQGKVFPHDGPTV